MMYGTPHFVSVAAAVAYYKPYGYKSTLAAVLRKKQDGEIHIGPPTLKPGQTLRIIDGGLRYAIQEVKS